MEPGGSARLLTGWVMAWSGVDRLIGLAPLKKWGSSTEIRKSGQQTVGSVVQEFKAGVWAGDGSWQMASDAVVMMSSLREEEGGEGGGLPSEPWRIPASAAVQRREVSAGEVLGKLGSAGDGGQRDSAGCLSVPLRPKGRNSHRRSHGS